MIHGQINYTKISTTLTDVTNRSAIERQSRRREYFDTAPPGAARIPGVMPRRVCYKSRAMILFFGIILAILLAGIVLRLFGLIGIPFLVLIGPALLWRWAFGDWGMGPWLLAPGAALLFAYWASPRWQAQAKAQADADRLATAIVREQLRANADPAYPKSKSTDDPIYTPPPAPIKPIVPKSYVKPLQR